MSGCTQDVVGVSHPIQLSVVKSKKQNIFTLVSYAMHREPSKPLNSHKNLVPGSRDSSATGGDTERPQEPDGGTRQYTRKREKIAAVVSDR